MHFAVATATWLSAKCLTQVNKATGLWRHLSNFASRTSGGLEAERRHVEFRWGCFDFFKDLFQAFTVRIVQLFRGLHLDRVFGGWGHATRWQRAGDVHDDGTVQPESDKSARPVAIVRYARTFVS